MFEAEERRRGWGAHFDGVGNGEVVIGGWRGGTAEAVDFYPKKRVWCPGSQHPG